MFILFADKNKLTILEKEIVTSGSSNVYNVEFKFSEDWDSLEKTAVFKVGSDSQSVALDDDVPICTIPKEVLTESKRPLMIGVYGTAGEETILPTVWANAGTIREGTTLPDESPSTPGDNGGISEEQLKELEAQIAKKGDALEYDGLDLKLLSDGKEISSVPLIGGGGNLPDITGVLAFNGRQGSVKPQAGDYTAEMVGALPDTFTESDPTVPEWAKQPEKPTYTAEEVGADPAGAAEQVKEEIEDSLESKLDKAGGVVTGAISFESAESVALLGLDDEGLTKASRASKQAIAISSGGLQSTGDLRVQTGSGVVEFSTSGDSAEELTVLSGIEADPDDEFSVPNVQQTRELVLETVTNEASKVEAKIPTNVSQLNNDTGFITGAEADTKIADALADIGDGEGVVGPPGPAGAVYTPSVSESGVISWTNNGNLQNPTPVNIMGPAGQNGQNGENGENGQNGIDGFSPTVSIEEIEGGHKITITDADGEQSFNVMDGSGGSDGAQELITFEYKTLQNISDLDGIDFPCCLHLINSWLGGMFLDDIVYVKNADEMIRVFTMDNVIYELDVYPDGSLHVVLITNLSDEIDNVKGDLEAKIPDVIKRCVWIYSAGDDISLFAENSTNVASFDEFIGYKPAISNNNIGLILVDNKLYWTKFNITAINESSDAAYQEFTQDPILIGPIDSVDVSDELITIKDTEVTNISQLPTNSCCIHAINSTIGFPFNDDICYVRIGVVDITVYTIDGHMITLNIMPDGNLSMAEDGQDVWAKASNYYNKSQIDNMLAEASGSENELITIKDTEVTNISQLPMDKLPCCLHMINSTFYYEFNDDIIYVASVPGLMALWTMDGKIAYFTFNDDGVITFNQQTSFVDGASLVEQFYTKNEIDSKLANIDSDVDDELITIKDTSITNISQLPIDKLPCCFHMVNSDIIDTIFKDDIIYISEVTLGEFSIYAIDGTIINMVCDEDDGTLSFDKFLHWVDSEVLLNELSQFYNRNEIDSLIANIALTPGQGVQIEDGEISVETPITPITEEEYTALTDEQKNADVAWLVTDANNESGGGGNSGGGMSIPRGVIWIWYPQASGDVPEGWALCDGQNGTPDLRGKFVLGSSEAHTVGETGGSEEVTLTVEQMPKHTHVLRIASTTPKSSTAGHVKEAIGYAYDVNYTNVDTNSEEGSSQPHPNMPPYYVLTYIMKL